MSIQAMSWALSQRIVTSPTARHVLLCLANYAGEDGCNAFPSIARLAMDTGLSERAIQTSLRELVTCGAINLGNQDIVKAFIKSADRRPRVYDIAIGRGAADAPRKATGCISRPNGVHLTTERGAADAPDPSLTVKEPNDDIRRTKFDRLADSLWEAGGAALDQTSTELMILTRPLAWLDAGCDLEADILPAIRAATARASPQRIRSWKYFEQPVADAKATRLAPMPEGRPDERTHRKSPDATARENHLAGILQAVAGARGT